MTCLRCGRPCGEKKWCSDACKNEAWSDCRKFGALLVDAGAITHQQIAAVSAALRTVQTLVELAEKAPPSPCTGATTASEDKP